MFEIVRNTNDMSRREELEFKLELKLFRGRENFIIEMIPRRELNELPLRDLIMFSLGRAEEMEELKQVSINKNFEMKLFMMQESYLGITKL